MELDKKKISRIMVEQDLYQKDVADKAGMSRGNFSTLINGKSCQERTAYKIAKALGVDVTEIIKAPMTYTILRSEEGGRNRMWIPVSEKLPKPGRRYLTTMKYKESGIVGVYDAVYGSDRLWHGENYQPINDRLAVIAWMPLPESYKEELE